MNVPRPAVALLLTVALSLHGCGTICGLASDREVFVVTNPSGATLLANGIPSPGVSPSVVALDPGEEWRVDAHLDDLKGGTQITRSRRIGVVIADVLLTAGLGLWIDYLSGAMYFFPDRVILNLGKVEASAPTVATAPPQPLDPGAQDPVAADPAWPAANTGGPPPKDKPKDGVLAGETSTRDVLKH